ncbi:MAG: PHP domain-containing protein [Proteobacteria bacterium]|nr:PHP domain-containing protein [Pseudomonadota bacterium]
MRLLPWLLLVGCAQEGGHYFEVPAEGAELGHRGLIPVIVHLESPELNDVRLAVNGRGLDELLPITRRRISFMGEGHDWIATVDLGHLKTGTYTLRARVGGTVSTVEVVVPERNRIDLELVDEASNPVAGRVFVFRDGEPMDLSSGFGIDHNQRDIDVSAVDCLEGECVVFLEPGDYELLGWRGLRGGLTRVPLTVDADQTVQLAVPIEVPTPGELASDLHIHTGRSGDSWVPLWLRYESLASAGLDRFVLTDHHNPAKPSELFAGTGIAEDFGVLGVERDLRVGIDGESRAGGHMNVFPLASGVSDLIPPVQTEPPATTLAAYREAPIAEEVPVVLMLNHPRGIHFRPEREPQPQWQLFNRMGFDHTVPFGSGVNAWMGVPTEDEKPPGIDFDAVEVVNRFSIQLYEEVRADWFELLNRGVFMVGTGNSDSHGLSVEMAGMTATLVRTEDEAIAPWTEALREGRARVTSGVFVDLTLEGATAGDIRVGGDAEATVRVQAPSWVPSERVAVIQDGVEVWSAVLTETDRDANGVLDRTFTVPLTIAADGWVIAEAGFAVGEIPEDLGVYGQIAPGYVPVGFTNPVRLDVEGLGWDPAN